MPAFLPMERVPCRAHGYLHLLNLFMAFPPGLLSPSTLLPPDEHDLWQNLSGCFLKGTSTG